MVSDFDSCIGFPVEPKLAKERGKYLHPEVFGLPEKLSVDYEERVKADKARGGLVEDLVPRRGPPISTGVLN